MSLVRCEQAVGPITLLELGERLTVENIPELRDVFEKLEVQGRKFLLFECSRVRVVDSLGIGALVTNWVSLNKRGGTLKLVNPSARLREVLEVVRLHKVIECFDDIGVALRSFDQRLPDLA